MKYIKPRSLTWWVGLVAIALGIVGMGWPDAEVQDISLVLGMLLGGADGSPATLVVLGMGLIGLRAAPGVSGAS